MNKIKVFLEICSKCRLCNTFQKNQFSNKCCWKNEKGFNDSEKDKITKDKSEKKESARKFNSNQYMSFQQKKTKFLIFFLIYKSSGNQLET
jgi:hypothetical protein